MNQHDKTTNRKIIGIVTTPREREDLESAAQATARRLGLKFVPRAGLSLKKLFEEFGVAGVWVEGETPVLHTRLGPIKYHEGSAVLRTKPNRTERDALARALDLRPDDHILDATPGMAVDALVAATYLNDSGRITGVEASPLLCELVRLGLRRHTFKTPALAAAAQRIELVCASHAEYLESCGGDSFDAVYFDPMFDHTVQASAMMQRIRCVAVEDPLTPEALALAGRAARRCVVVKTRRGFFSDINFHDYIPSGSSVGYGVIHV